VHHLRGQRALTALAEIVADYGPLAGLIGVTATLAVNGHRDERRRRRDNHARAIQAVVAYSEMPYRIRRRRHEPEHASSERARLSDAFSDIQAELANCQALIRADPDLEIRDAYEDLVATLRQIGGALARDAWSKPAVANDKDMNMPDVFEALAPVRAEQQKCETLLAASTRPWTRSTRT
jgi:hypothetical protein